MYANVKKWYFSSNILKIYVRNNSAMQLTKNIFLRHTAAEIFPNRAVCDSTFNIEVVQILLKKKTIYSFFWEETYNLQLD